MISTTTVKKKYDGMGNRLSQTINNERTTAYTYTARNQLESVTNALGEVNRYTYDDNGRLATQTNQLGDTVAYQYDKDSRVTRVRDQENREVSYTYDKNGNVTHVSTGNQLTSRYTYDVLNRLTQATTGDDKPITAIYTYDSVGNVTSITDGNNHTTTYTYDQLNNITSHTTPLGDVTSYGYDVNNRLKTMTQPNGTVLTYDYDKLDRLVSKTPQDKPEHQVLYGYDKDGQRISMTDTTGESKYTYNIDGQLTAVTNGDNQTVKYEYDTFGNLSKLVYPDETAVQYTYDALDRLVKVVDRAGKETIYTYDKAGNVVETKRGNGSKAKMTYNRSNQLTKLVNVDSHGAVVSEYAYTYNSAGMIERESITVNGVTMHQQFTYDGSGQLMKTTATHADGHVLFTESYAYDGAGNRTKLVREATDSTTETTFTYDDNNRLTKRKVGDKVTTYSYDVNGNRVKQVSDDEELTYGYDVYNRLMAVRDKQSLLMAALYDGDDNRVFLASRTTQTFGYQLFVIPEDKKRKSPYTSVGGFSLSTFWHAITQLFVQSVSVSSSATAKEWTDTFEDLSIAYHKQQAKEKAEREGLVVEHGDTDVKPGDEDVTYASDVNETLIPYTTVEDSMHVYDVKHYVNDVNRKHAQVLSEYDGHKKQHYSYDYGHQRLNQHNHREGKTRTYTTDGRGSVESLSDSDDEESDRRYSTFGLPTKHNAITQPFGYNSEAHDVTGLQYLRARYYDPSAGTFITQDTYAGTLQNPITQNRYTYVGNNPINYIDPSGHYMNLGTGAGVPSILQHHEPEPVSSGNALQIRPKNFLTDMEISNNVITHDPDQPVINLNSPHLDSDSENYHNDDNGNDDSDTPVISAEEERRNKLKQLLDEFPILAKSKLAKVDNLYKNATMQFIETLRHYCETGEYALSDSHTQIILQYAKSGQPIEVQEFYDKVWEFLKNRDKTSSSNSNIKTTPGLSGLADKYGLETLEVDDREFFVVQDEYILNSLENADVSGNYLEIENSIVFNNRKGFITMYRRNGDLVGVGSDMGFMEFKLKGGHNKPSVEIEGSALQSLSVKGEVGSGILSAEISANVTDSDTKISTKYGAGVGADFNKENAVFSGYGRVETQSNSGFVDVKQTVENGIQGIDRSTAYLISISGGATAIVWNGGKKLFLPLVKFLIEIMENAVSIGDM